MESRIGDVLNMEQRNREFLALLCQHEIKLAACVHAIVPSWHDAEDILQETRLQLWREYDTFRPECDFLVWARTIARFVVRTRITESHRKPLLLSDKIQDLVMGRLDMMHERPDQRLELLAECLKRLSKDALNLLQRCYTDRRKIKDVAVEVGRSLAGTYMALSRIRRELFDCVEKHLREDEGR